MRGYHKNARFYIKFSRSKKEMYSFFAHLTKFFIIFATNNLIKKPILNHKY